MNGILLVNKNKGMTSREVVNEVSKHFHTKKIGHTGTLDPIAEGVLILCIGNTTKLCELLTSSYKEYIATIQLGYKTDTLDSTGTIIETKEYDVTHSQIREVLHSFLGSSIQETPIYSAAHVNGKRLYEYARMGEKVDLPKRNITIKKIELIDYKEDKIIFKTTVSKGTYIRALIDDICKQLNTVGTMTSLIRTKQGKFLIEDTYTLEEIKKGNYTLLSKEQVLEDLEKIYIDEEIYNKIKNGGIIDKTFKNKIACLVYKEKIVAIYKEYEKDHSKAKPFKMFIEE